jgi:signal transduction histidine kinase
VDVSDDVPIVNVDANMIERSIINLVDNAIKYTPNGGIIKVGVKRKDDNLLITISDNGYGISPENIRQLFQRHFRIRRKEHNRVKGSGLGLFIVRSVARHHGGDAFVESVEGQGSTFGIRIPLEGENLLGASTASE